MVLGEDLTLKTIIGGLIVVIGIVVAILFDKNRTAQDQMTGSIASVVAFGLASALAQALGLIAMKPVLIAGTDPIAASAIRTGLAAIAITVVALSTGQARLRHQHEPANVVSTVLAGILGYVVAVSLLLVAEPGERRASPRRPVDITDESEGLCGRSRVQTSTYIDR